MQLLASTGKETNEPPYHFLSVTAVRSEDTTVDNTENTTEAPPRRAPQKRRARWRRAEMWEGKSWNREEDADINETISKRLQVAGL